MGAERNVRGRRGRSFVNVRREIEGDDVGGCCGEIEGEEEVNGRTAVGGDEKAE